MHPGPTQDAPRMDPGNPSSGCLMHQARIAPRGAWSVRMETQPRMEHGWNTELNPCFIRVRSVAPSSLISYPSSLFSLALRERVRERAFSAIIPYCKQMSTPLSYSCRGFRRNPLRHNGLRAGKSCAPLARQFGPARRDRRRNPLHRQELEIPGSLAGKGQEFRAARKIL